MNKIINIMTSNICNAKCECCVHPTLYNKDNFTEMTDLLWNKITYELFKWKNIDMFQSGNHKYSLTGVNFGCLDEPLLDTKIIQRIKDVKKIGYYNISIVTNASLLTLDKVKELYDAGVTEFYMSLIEPTSKEYGEFTGLKFGQVVMNINNAIEFLRDKSVIIKVACSLDTYNKIPLYNKVFSPDFVHKYCLFNLRDNRIDRSKPNIAVKDSCFYFMKYKHIDSGCDVAMERLWIKYDGSIPLCNLDLTSNYIGNIQNSSIKELIEKQMTILKTDLSKIECCQGCYTK
jgi:MoaA/NifB/PqqE/SkfB family radical SAM enzyme